MVSKCMTMLIGATLALTCMAMAPPAVNAETRTYPAWDIYGDGQLIFAGSDVFQIYVMGGPGLGLTYGAGPDFWFAQSSRDSLPRGVFQGRPSTFLITYAPAPPPRVGTGTVSVTDIPDPRVTSPPPGREPGRKR